MKEISKKELIEMINDARGVEIGTSDTGHFSYWATLPINGRFYLYFRVGVSGFDWNDIMNTSIMDIQLHSQECKTEHLRLSSDEPLYLYEFIGTNKEDEAINFVKEWIAQIRVKVDHFSFSKIDHIKEELHPIIDKMKNETHGTRNQLIQYIVQKMTEDLEVKE